MRRYRAEDGLVSKISDDIEFLQDAIHQNILERLGAIIKNHGVKGGADAGFDLSYVELGPDSYEVSCSGIGPVVFADHIYITESDSVLYTNVELLEGDSKQIYLKYTIEYSNDKEDDFRPGHPVDENGDPPAWGYNIEQDYTLELCVESSEDITSDQIVNLGLITRNSAKGPVTITDYRAKNVLTLNDIGLRRENTDEVEDLQITSVFQASILKAQSAVAPSNDTPSQTNMLANKIYMDVSWIPTDDVFAYQVKLQLLDFHGNKIRQPHYKIVPQVDGERAKTLIEVIGGTKYLVSVRILSSNPNHDPGPWVSQEAYAGYPDSLEELQIPAPTLSMMIRQEELRYDFEEYLEEQYGWSYSTPTIIQIDARPTEPTPEPNYIQIFKSEAPPPESGNMGLGQGTLVYEGTARSYLHVLEEEETCYFSARTVCAGGFCSSVTSSPTPWTGKKFSSPEDHTFVISIPISSVFDETSNFPRRLTKFDLPQPFCELHSWRFYSTGTIFVGAMALPIQDMTENIQICTAKDWQIDEGAFVAGETNGFRVLDNASLHGIAASSFSSMYHQVAPGYFPHFLRSSQYSEAFANWSRGSAPWDQMWPGGDTIAVWLTMFDWEYTTFDFVLSGTLHLVFRKIMQVEEEE